MQAADEAAFGDGFTQEYLSCGIHKELLERYGDKEMLRLCCNMHGILEPLVDNVEKEKNRLANLKKALDE